MFLIVTIKNDRALGRRLAAILARMPPPQPYRCSRVFSVDAARGPRNANEQQRAVEPIGVCVMARDYGAISWCGALGALAFLIGSTPANPQELGLWGGWDGPRGRYWRDYGPPPRSRYRTLPPRYYDGYGYDYDDREQFEPRVRRAPTVLDGGGRPPIDPKAPEKVPFATSYEPGSVVIDTKARKLYYVLSASEAYGYPISVGRVGFTWTGTEAVSRKQPWPDWYPPVEMRQRDPSLPEKMTGGIRNPLGVLAIYLGNSLYRIHGTNDAKTIGLAASSGCFRMLNAHVLHLSSLVDVGTKVRVVTSVAADQARKSKAETGRTNAKPRESPSAAPAGARAAVGAP